jgi:formate hydrogenlyase subunit 6/NADH:ubiquinone oxidoreductase subunit I
LKLLDHIKAYFSNIYEAVTTISVGMWITFKTAFFERKVTIQYPSHDILEGEPKDTSVPTQGKLNPPFEALLGASQQKYKGPLSAQVAERYRGLLGYDEPSCIACLLCAQNCPIDVIRVKGVKIDGRKGKAPTTFRIDYSKCMFCGLCVEVCPTDAVFFTRQFEGATFDYRTLIREFISPELSLERMQLAEEAKKQKKKREDRETPQVGD